MNPFQRLVAPVIASAVAILGQPQMSSSVVRLAAISSLAVVASTAPASAQVVVFLEPSSIQVGVGGGSGNVLVYAPSSYLWQVSTQAPWITVKWLSHDSFSYQVSPNSGLAPRMATITVSGAVPLPVTQAGLATPVGGLDLVMVPPCRVADTRDATRPAGFGPPALAAGVVRTFNIRGSSCSIPPDARAFSLNVTVVPTGPLGYLTIWPAGQNQPFVSTLNSFDGRVKANAAFVLEGSGGVSVMATDATELVLDINGVFVDADTNPEGMAFHPIAPCRLVDTREAAGPSGGPILSAGVPRSFPIRGAKCGIPADAQGYSLNVTAVPSGPLGYLSLWGTGQPQPFVSTLNAPTGATVANAAIVPAGDNGEVSVFAQGPAHVVLDINGYFSWDFGFSWQGSGYHYFPVQPCRLVDTRNPAGSLGGPALVAGGVGRSFPVASANCGLSANAHSYALNATVVPPGVLGYLTLWATGRVQPFVSTLNAIDDRIVSNAAIVPSGSAGSVSVFVTEGTHLVLDTNGFFAK